MATLSAVMDIECYSNYFLVMFMRLTDNRIIAFEQYDGKDLDIPKIKEILHKYEIITFNGNKYDLPVLKLALSGANCATLKLASDDIINNMKYRDFNDKYKPASARINHIDLIELCPGKASLKLYGARLHCEKLQELPIEPGSLISTANHSTLKNYCSNDLYVTARIYKEIESQVQLRRKMSSNYGLDLKSKSESQIAEAVLKEELTKRLGKRISPQADQKTRFRYDLPEFLSPLKQNDRFQEIRQILESKDFEVDFNGRISMPKELDGYKIKIGRTVYQMGMGGLHSTEKSEYHHSSDSVIISDWDVTSYYPMLMLVCRLFPPHIGEVFLEVFKGIVEERIVSKKTDPIKADALKIVINGSFGKLGSVYSILYAPKLMIQVTVTGQLALLMLISELERIGIPVFSGNTDGIVMKCHRSMEPAMINTIRQWEKQTGLSMERTDYQMIYSRDVNNYFAVKFDGKVKKKGCFTPANLKKNPSNDICYQAVIDYIYKGVEFEETLKTCNDIRQFLTVRTVNGGAVKSGHYLGKAIRWYYAKGERGVINYKTNGNTVGKSQGGRPLMDIPKEFPLDLDYEWYIRECKELMSAIGKPMTGQMELFS